MAGRGTWGTTTSNSAGRVHSAHAEKGHPARVTCHFLGLWKHLYRTIHSQPSPLLGRQRKCHGVKPDSSNSYFGKGGPVSNNTLQPHNAQCFSKPIYIHYLLNPTWPPVHNGEPEMWETEDVGLAGRFLVSPPTPSSCPLWTRRQAGISHIPHSGNHGKQLISISKHPGTPSPQDWGSLNCSPSFFLFNFLLYEK